MHQHGRTCQRPRQRTQQARTTLLHATHLHSWACYCVSYHSARQLESLLSTFTQPTTIMATAAAAQPQSPTYSAFPASAATHSNDATTSDIIPSTTTTAQPEVSPPTVIPKSVSHPRNQDFANPPLKPSFRPTTSALLRTCAPDRSAPCAPLRRRDFVALGLRENRAYKENCDYSNLDAF